MDTGFRDLQPDASDFHTEPQTLNKHTKDPEISFIASVIFMTFMTVLLIIITIVIVIPKKPWTNPKKTKQHQDNS